MDALRKSLGADARSGKKPPKSERVRLPDQFTGRFWGTNTSRLSGNTQFSW
jgi:hypothetical protein